MSGHICGGEGGRKVRQCTPFAYRKTNIPNETGFYSEITYNLHTEYKKRVKKIFHVRISLLKEPRRD